MSALLTAERLELAYGEISACRDVSFHVDVGEIVTLIGANGAGKSTTLRAIAGALLPRTGAIRFRGEDITRLPSYERTGLGISLVPEGRRVFPFLTVRENLELGAYRRGVRARRAQSLERICTLFPCSVGSNRSCALLKVSSLPTAEASALFTSALVCERACRFSIDAAMEKSFLVR